ncbi:MAG: TonB-dependent receptor [Alphaproteobacteria bacterium]|nr:TonB-dependent receptor [Alphaproteobacteria bacterium]
MRLLPLLLLTSSWPALAQVAAPPESPSPPTDRAPDPDEEEPEEIVVTGSRNVAPRGSVIGDIEPEIVLRSRDIRAYGASNLGELLAELSPLTGSIQGRGGDQPVVLLGGRRISSFREIRDLPPEAVTRIDILPEEVALKYGYRADQKVVNFVLRRRFEAVTADAETRLATGGGRWQHKADVNYLRIAQGSRLSADAEYQHAGPLFEDERNVIGADPDRTLLAASDSAKLNATYNRTLFGNISATLSGELEGQDSLASLGRTDDGSRRLLRDSKTRTGSINYALTGERSGWQWSLTGGYVRDWSTTTTDRERMSGIGRDRSKSIAETIESEATASGTLFGLPAGAVSATFKAGFNLRDLNSESLRAGIFNSADLSRHQASGQANVDIPLFDDDGPIGALTANANLAVDELSDFGTLTSYGYGFNWQPFDAARLIGSVTHEDGPPTIQQLGNPLLVTPNVRVLDIATGRTVDITRIEGGNPALLADQRRVFKLGATVKPITGTDLTLRADFTDARIDNAIASFSTATPEIEAAFPQRFERDAAGTLLRIDSRPVNFKRSKQRQLRWGFNWSETLEAPPPRGDDGQPLTAEQIEERRAQWREGRRGARGDGGAASNGGSGRREGGAGFRGGGRGGAGAGGGGFGGGGFGGARQGRVTLALFHTWRLEDSILIRPGVPELDLLSGSATGGRGGQSRHSIEAQAGYNRNGLGARIDVDWQSATRVRANGGNGAPSSQDLRFGALATVNLRLFADLGRQQALVRAAPFFRGSRLTLAVDNVFDQRLDVRDANGATPIGYQPDLLDPLGRSIRLSFRKLFY